MLAGQLTRRVSPHSAEPLLMACVHQTLHPSPVMALRVFYHQSPVVLMTSPKLLRPLTIAEQLEVGAQHLQKTASAFQGFETKVSAAQRQGNELAAKINTATVNVASLTKSVTTLQNTVDTTKKEFEEWSKTTQKEFNDKFELAKKNVNVELKKLQRKLNFLYAGIAGAVALLVGTSITFELLREEFTPFYNDTFELRQLFKNHHAAVMSSLITTLYETEMQEHFEQIFKQERASVQKRFDECVFKPWPSLSLFSRAYAHQEKLKALDWAKAHLRTTPFADILNRLRTAYEYQPQAEDTKFIDDLSKKFLENLNARQAAIQKERNAAPSTDSQNQRRWLSHLPYYETLRAAVLGVKPPLKSDAPSPEPTA